MLGNYKSTDLIETVDAMFETYKIDKKHYLDVALSICMQFAPAYSMDREMLTHYKFSEPDRVYGGSFNPQLLVTYYGTDEDELIEVANHIRGDDILGLPVIEDGAYNAGLTACSVFCDALVIVLAEKGVKTARNCELVFSASQMVATQMGVNVHHRVNLDTGRFTKQLVCENLAKFGACKHGDVDEKYADMNAKCTEFLLFIDTCGGALNKLYSSEFISRFAEDMGFKMKDRVMHMYYDNCSRSLYSSVPMFRKELWVGKTMNGDGIPIEEQIQHNYDELYDVVKRFFRLIPYDIIECISFLGLRGFKVLEDTLTYIVEDLAPYCSGGDPLDYGFKDIEDDYTKDKMYSSLMKWMQILKVIYIALNNENPSYDNKRWRYELIELNKDV